MIYFINFFSKYKYPNFVDCNDRHKSFSKINSDQIASKRLSEAGFFSKYSKNEEKILCFSCGTNIIYYEGCDVWKQHALECKNSCRYLTMLKGSQYITYVKEKFVEDLWKL